MRAELVEVLLDYIGQRRRSHPGKRTRDVGLAATYLVHPKLQPFVLAALSREVVGKTLQSLAAEYAITRNG
jgi:hypothetical protein